MIIHCNQPNFYFAELLLLFGLFINTSCQSPKGSGSDIASNIQVKELQDTAKPDFSNNIMIVYQDTKESYWFGSWQDGLFRYDGDSIGHFTTEDGLASNRIDEIKEDQSGNIYLTTPGGICRYDGQQFTTLPAPAVKDNDWKLNSGDLWFKNPISQGHVYRYDGKQLHNLKLPPTPPGEDFIASHPNAPSPYGVYTIYEDDQGYIWFGTAVLGVCRYDGKTFDWISEPDVNELHDGPSNGVRSIVQDEHGDFWFNTAYRYRIRETNSSGMVLRDPPPFYEPIKSIGSLDGKPDGDLYEYLSITKDHNQNLWIATYDDGVWKYDGTTITHYRVQDRNQDITLFSIYMDHQGILWLGTHENGVFKFNGHEFVRFVP